MSNKSVTIPAIPSNCIAHKAVSSPLETAIAPVLRRFCIR